MAELKEYTKRVRIQNRSTMLSWTKQANLSCDKNMRFVGTPVSMFN